MNVVGRRKLPLGVAAALLVLALATMGVAFGLWSKVLTIEGTVHTGTLHAKWSGAICSDFHPWPFDLSTIVIGEVEGKDVGSTTATVDPNNNNNLLLTVENGYPSYATDCEVEFINDGSIPWKIRGISMVPGANLTNCTVTGTQNVTMSCDQLTVVFIDGIGSQYEPGEIAASSLRLHVEQPADQNATYEFGISVCVAQWNESATMAECVAAAPPPPTPTPP